jgi:hypothetical protein
MSKFIGNVSAYAYAVSKGYTGTEEEFAELMADYAEVGQRAEDAAESALNSKTSAQTAATTATNKANEATTAAQTATTKAGEAQTSAQTASSKASEASQSASQASGYAQTAETAKTDAQTAKTQAETARDEAVTAKTAAETAQGKAEDAQAAAESVAESIPSDYSQLSEDVSDLKEGLSNNISSVFGEIVYADNAPIPAEWEYGNINSSGENANEDRHYYARFKTPFVPQKTTTINVKKILSSGLTNYIVVEYDATTHAMTDRVVYQTGTYPNIDIVATVGKEYRLCLMCNNSITIDLNNIDLYATITTSTEINKIITELSEANTEIAEIKGVLSPGKIVEQVNYTANAGYTAMSGTAVPGGTTYAYTNKIAVKPGDVIRGIAKNNGADSVMRFIAAFNGNTAVSASGAENVYNYTVPDGVDGLVITGYQGTSGDVTSIPNYYKFSDGFVDKKTDSNGFVVKNASIIDGESVIIPLNNVSKNVILSVDATVSSFNSLEFGRTGITEKIAVTSQNVIFYDTSGTALSTTPHGITIENTISIRIIHDADVNVDQVSVIVSSNGIISDTITKGWSAYRRGNVYVKSVDTSLTDCTVGFSMRDINKALWLFGDSYCSITFNRWVGQLKLAGYLGNILLNAYPGESATQETPSFINLINKGNPKAIVWACGMNDNADSSSAPSSMWLNAVNVFITACESRNIIPILTTIPTVPTINNEQKNAWVKNSGKRYIDFAKAVGANSSGDWYEGMLSQDGIHPTELGAIALFNRAVADCPELMEQ